MSIKTLIKRSLSTLLAASFMIASLSNTTYAIESNATGNNGSSQTTSSGGDFGVDDPPRIGLRFSVIDAETKNVISHNVIDYWFMTEDQFNNAAFRCATSYLSPGGGYYKGVKTQNYDTENEITHIYKNDSKYNTFPLVVLQSNPDDWASYTNKQYVSHGKEYVEWLGKDAKGNQSGASFETYM